MQIIDFSILEQFCELLGENGKNEARELVNLYLQDAPEQIKTMQDSLEANEIEIFKRAAHTFKSSSANVGASGIQTLCQSMENEATTGNLDTLKTPLTEVITQFQQVKDELQKWSDTQ